MTKWTLAAVAAGCLAFGAGCATDTLLPNIPPVTAEPTQRFTPGRFVWVDLLTEDPAAVKKFYGQLFGWEFASSGGGGSYAQASHRGVPVAGIVKLEKDDPDISESVWIPSLSVANVDEGAALVARSNGKVWDLPQEVPKRGRMALVTDPQGAPLALIRASSGDPRPRSIEPGRPMWNELWTEDVASAAAFYAQLAGWTRDTHRLPDGEHYDVFVQGSRWRAGAVATPGAEIQPNWLPWILVEDAAQTVQRALGLGGRALLSPEPGVHEGRVGILADPSGAVFGVQEWPESLERGSLSQ